MTEITVDGSSRYCSKDGVLFTKDKTKLLAYPANKDGNTYAIPDTVTAVAGCAFCECGNLTDISVPAGVTSIGETAFFDCENLSSITFAEESKLKSIGEMGFCNCNNLTNILLPDSVTTIEDCAFSNCSTLTSIIIPSDVKTLGDQAFAGCNNLTDAVFESAAPPETVGSKIFDKCSNGLTIWVPNDAAVSRYETITNFSGYQDSIRATAEAADNDIFTDGILTYTITSAESKTAEINTCEENWKGALSIPKKVPYFGNIFNVTSIRESAFGSCTGLAGITIPASVTSIGDGAFAGCTGLTRITAADGSKNFYTDNNGVLFTDHSATLVAYPAGKTAAEYSIPSGVTGIGDGAFKDCTRLTGITIPASVTSIGRDVFADCTGLTGITIPNSVTFISSNTFAYCTGLTNIAIPNSVTSIGDDAFSHCTGLTGITIPNSVTSIGKEALCYCTGLTSIAIPVSVTSISNDTFVYCTGLTGITIPSSVTSIGQRAFLGCTGLTGITIPNSVTSIGDGAFNSCSGLTGITIPNSVTSIGMGAFEDCTGLTDVKVLNSAASLGLVAFAGCTGLKNVILRGTSVSFHKDAFYENISVSIHFYVPAACSDTYTSELNQDVMGMAAAVVTGVRFVSGIGLLKAKNVANGTKFENLQLPGTLTLTIDDGSGKDKTETLKNVTWVSNPDYTPDTAGTYTFTPVLSSGYLLDGDAAVKVTVKGKRTERDTSESVPIPAEITDAATEASAGLSGATFPAGVTSVFLSATQPAQNGTPDPQAEDALRLAVSDPQLSVIGTPILYNLKLLDQNGNPISFTGSVTVKIPLPAGLHGTPHVFR